jgi:hypothetical protein
MTVNSMISNIKRQDTLLHLLTGSNNLMREENRHLLSYRRQFNSKNKDSETKYTQIGHLPNLFYFSPLYYLLLKL